MCAARRGSAFSQAFTSCRSPEPMGPAAAEFNQIAAAHATDSATNLPARTTILSCPLIEDSTKQESEIAKPPEAFATAQASSAKWSKQHCVGWMSGVHGMPCHAEKGCTVARCRHPKRDPANEH